MRSTAPSTRSPTSPASSSPPTTRPTASTCRPTTAGISSPGPTSTRPTSTAEYWNELWRWYDNGGCQVVAHYLLNLDLSAFDPKAPPPQTNAFFEIVNASRSPEDAELADALDAHCTSQGLHAWPAAVTIADIVAVSSQSDFIDYLKDRKNSRRIPHRFEACGYTPVRNPDAEDGLWRDQGRRQVIYARSSISFRDRLRAAQNRASQ